MWDFTPTAAVSAGITNLWKFARQFPLAVRERVIAVGDHDTWPPQTWEYETGTVTAAVDNGDNTVTITDASKTWATSPHHRWVDPVAGSGGVPSWDWLSYDCVIDAPASLSEPDPRKVEQGAIGVQPTASSVTFFYNVGLRTAERVITSVGDLVGRRYWFLRANGTNWAKEFPTAPNAVAYGTGLVESSAAGTLTASRLENADLITAHVGAADVVYMGADSKLQRGALTAFAGGVLTYTGTTSLPVVGERFFVIESGGVWRWNVTGGFLQSAYSGLRGEGYHAHDITDEVGTASLPSLTFPVLYGTDSLSCPIDPEDVALHGDPDNDGRDIFYWIPQDNACGDRDLFVNSGLLRCFRGWWSELMGICTHYMPPSGADDYTGAAVLPSFTVATWFYFAGINIHSGTVGTHTGTSMPCALGVPHTPIPLWWTIRAADGSPLISGYEANYDGAHINGTFSAAHDGKTVYASTGPTRKVPKRVGRFRDVVYFLPDLDDEGTGPATPTNAKPGTWTIRPKSTHYRVSDMDGVVSDGSLSRHAIAEGDYVRLAGDNFADPGFPALLSTSGGPDPRADFYNAGAVGTRSESVQARIVASASGTATGGSNVRLVDTSKNWLAVDFYPDSNGVTHTFVPDDVAGDHVSCVVTGMTIGGLWADVRFPGFAGPLVGFTVEFLVSGTSFGDPDAVIDKRLITAGTSAGFIEWGEPATITSAANSGRIREPAVLNRWAGLPVRLVRTVDGTVTNDVTVKITANHDDTLFLPDVGFTIDEHTTYAIELEIFGAVYHVESGEYVSTADAGDDPRNPGTNPFLPDPTRNLEDHYTEYGLPQPNDVTFGMLTGWQQLYDAINVLTVAPGPTGNWTDAGLTRLGGWHTVTSSYADWVSKALDGDPGGPEAANTSYFNYNGPAASPGVAPASAWQAEVDYNYVSGAWSGPRWFGAVNRWQNTYRVTPTASPFSYRLDFYNIGAPPVPFVTPSTYAVATTAFDNNGDAVNDGTWTRFYQASGVTTTTPITTGTLGNLTGPNAAAEPVSSELPGTAPNGTLGTVVHANGYRVTAVQTTRTFAFKFVA